MKRIWVTALALLLAGCGIQPSGVLDAGEPPTGVAAGVTLYFVDAQDRLQPQLRDTGRLGTISEAVSLLLTGPGASGLRTEIAPVGTTRVMVAATPGEIELILPLAATDVSPLGLDQIVCTALGVHVQSGGTPQAKVRVRLTQPSPDTAGPRTCPLLR